MKIAIFVVIIYFIIVRFISNARQCIHDSDIRYRNIE